MHQPAPYEHFTNQQPTLHQPEAEQYQEAENDEEEEDDYRPNVSKNMIRCKTNSNVYSLTNYGIRYLVDSQGTEQPNYVVVQGTGVTTSKVVEIAEKIKEKFRLEYGTHLYQITKIASLIFDSSNMLIPESLLNNGKFHIVDRAGEEGFRRVSCIEIQLMLDPPEQERQKDVGYQYDNDYYTN